MNTARVIQSAERLYTLHKRASVSNDRDTRREELIAEFNNLATDLGKIATKFRAPLWKEIGMAVVDLHSVAVHADEGKVGPFVPLGGEMALITQLHSFAAILGFVLADAATADEDDAAMMAVEGMRSAAE
jgi:hypothetical protein